MSGKDKRSLCWGAALGITAGSVVFLAIHWAGAVGEPPYGVTTAVGVALIVLVYAGHQAGIEKPQLVYVRDDAPTKRELAEAYVDEISSHHNLRHLPRRPGRPDGTSP